MSSSKSTSDTPLSNDAQAFVDRLVEIIEKRGDEAYLGEPVTQKQHFLQAAWLAEQSGQDTHTIVAALLHDVGHFSGDFPQDALENGINNHHDATGERMLRPWFPLSVCRPVAMHVNAKRYLCAVEADYLANLSPASVHSLQLQGGPLSGEQISQFEKQRFFEQGIAVRRFDDQAKDPNMHTPELDHFLPMITATVSNKPLDNKT